MTSEPNGGAGFVEEQVVSPVPELEHQGVDPVRTQGLVQRLEMTGVDTGGLQNTVAYRVKDYCSAVGNDRQSKLEPVHEAFRYPRSACGGNDERQSGIDIGPQHPLIRHGKLGDSIEQCPVEIAEDEGTRSCEALVSFVIITSPIVHCWGVTGRFQSTRFIHIEIYAVAVGVDYQPPSSTPVSITYRKVRRNDPRAPTPHRTSGCP